MDLKELKTKKESELHALLAKLREELRELKFKNSSHQLKDVRKIRNVKKNIAQVLTLLNTNSPETSEVDIETNKEENK